MTIEYCVVDGYYGKVMEWNRNIQGNSIECIPQNITETSFELSFPIGEDSVFNENTRYFVKFRGEIYVSDDGTIESESGIVTFKGEPFYNFITNVFNEGKTVKFGRKTKPLPNVENYVVDECYGKPFYEFSKLRKSSYAYEDWNTITYMAGEFTSPVDGVGNVENNGNGYGRYYDYFLTQLEAKASGGYTQYPFGYYCNNGYSIFAYNVNGGEQTFTQSFSCPFNLPTFNALNNRLTAGAFQNDDNYVNVNGGYMTFGFGADGESNGINNANIPSDGEEVQCLYLPNAKIFNREGGAGDVLKPITGYFDFYSFTNETYSLQSGQEDAGEFTITLQMGNGYTNATFANTNLIGNEITNLPIVSSFSNAGGSEELNSRMNDESASDCYSCFVDSPITEPSGSTLIFNNAGFVLPGLSEVEKTEIELNGRKIDLNNYALSKGGLIWNLELGEEIECGLNNKYGRSEKLPCSVQNALVTTQGAEYGKNNYMSYGLSMLSSGVKDLGTAINGIKNYKNPVSLLESGVSIASDIASKVQQVYNLKHNDEIKSYGGNKSVMFGNCYNVPLSELKLCLVDWMKHGYLIDGFDSFEYNSEGVGNYFNVLECDSLFETLIPSRRELVRKMLEDLVVCELGNGSSYVGCDASYVGEYISLMS